MQFTVKCYLFLIILHSTYFLNEVRICIQIVIFLSCSIPIFILLIYKIIKRVKVAEIPQAAYKKQ